jgi:hypothetical protein
MCARSQWLPALRPSLSAQDRCRPRGTQIGRSRRSRTCLLGCSGPLPIGTGSWLAGALRIGFLRCGIPRALRQEVGAGLGWPRAEYAPVTLHGAGFPSDHPSRTRATLAPSSQGPGGMTLHVGRMHQCNWYGSPPPPSIKRIELKVFMVSCFVLSMRRCRPPLSTIRSSQGTQSQRCA